MTVKELIKLLEKCGQDKKVMGYDGEVEDWGEVFDFKEVTEYTDRVQID